MLWLLTRRPRFVRYFAEGDPADGGAGGGVVTPTLDDIPKSGGDADWKDSLGADIKDNPSLKDIKDIGTLAKNYIDTKKMVGDSLRLPPKDAPQEEADKMLWSKIGWPEKVDGYQKLDNKDEKGEALYDEEFGTWWYEIAHKHRLNNKQANEFLKDLHEHQMGVNTKDDTDKEVALKEAKDKLTLEYGQALDAKLEQTKRFLVQFGGDGLLEKLKDNGWSNDPDFLSLMIKVSSQWVQDHTISTNRGDLSLSASPDALRERLRQIEKTPEFKDPNSSRHKEALAMQTKIYEMLYPEKQ